MSTLLDILGVHKENTIIKKGYFMPPPHSTTPNPSSRGLSENNNMMFLRSPIRAVEQKWGKFKLLRRGADFGWEKTVINSEPDFHIITLWGLY